MEIRLTRWTRLAKKDRLKANHDDFIATATMAEFVICSHAWDRWILSHPSPCEGDAYVRTSNPSSNVVVKGMHMGNVAIKLFLGVVMV